MAEMTAERSRKLGRRWLVAALVSIGLQMPLGMLGFDMFDLPLNLLAFVCAFAAGEKSGWSDGFKAARSPAPASSGSDTTEGK